MNCRGEERVAQEQAAAYLESGAAARPQCGRHEFKQVRELKHVDFETYGPNVVFQLANMLWSGADGDVQ